MKVLSLFDGMAFKTMLRQLISKWGVMSTEMQMAYSNDGAVIAPKMDDNAEKWEEEKKNTVTQQPYIPPGNGGSNKQANNNNNAWAEFLWEVNSGG